MPAVRCSTRLRAMWTSTRLWTTLPASAKLTPEERAEQKKYAKLADSFTSAGQGHEPEYANQNAYDSIQVHGGSGFMLDVCLPAHLSMRASLLFIVRVPPNCRRCRYPRHASTGLILLPSSSLRLCRRLRNSRAKHDPYQGEMANKFDACTNAVKEMNNQELHDLRHAA